MIMAVMISKERVRAVIHDEEGDRMPFDSDANENVDAELKRHPTYAVASPLNRRSVPAVSRLPD